MTATGDMVQRTCHGGRDTRPEPTGIAASTPANHLPRYSDMGFTL